MDIQVYLPFLFVFLVYVFIKSFEGGGKANNAGKLPFCFVQTSNVPRCWLKCWSIFGKWFFCFNHFDLVWFCLHVYLRKKRPRKLYNMEPKIARWQLFLLFVFGCVFSGWTCESGCSFESFKLYTAVDGKQKVGSSWKSLELFEILKTQLRDILHSWDLPNVVCINFSAKKITWKKLIKKGRNCIDPPQKWRHFEDLEGYYIQVIQSKWPFHPPNIVGGHLL